MQVELLVQSRNVRERLDGEEDVKEKTEGGLPDALPSAQHPASSDNQKMPDHLQDMQHGTDVSADQHTSASAPKAAAEVQMQEEHDREPDSQQHAIVVQPNPGSISHRPETSSSPDSMPQAVHLTSGCTDKQLNLGPGVAIAIQSNLPPTTPAANLHSTHVVPDSSQQLPPNGGENGSSLACQAQLQHASPTCPNPAAETALPHGSAVAKSGSQQLAVPAGQLQDPQMAIPKASAVATDCMITAEADTGICVGAEMQAEEEKHSAAQHQLSQLGLVADALASPMSDELEAEIAQRIAEVEAHPKQAQGAGQETEHAKEDSVAITTVADQETGQVEAADVQTHHASCLGDQLQSCLTGVHSRSGCMPVETADALDATSNAAGTVEAPQQQQQQPPPVAQSSGALHQHSKSQHASFEFDPFLDSGELDAELAQLLDSAAAFRPAGAPDTAQAGPRPMSAEPKFNIAGLKPVSANTSLAQRPISAGHRPNSAGSRPNAAEARPNSAGSRPNSAGARPNSAGSRPNSAEARPNLATSRPSSAGSRPNPARSRPNSAGSLHASADVEKAVSDRDWIQAAPEPAGPCDDKAPKVCIPLLENQFMQLCAYAILSTCYIQLMVQVLVHGVHS